MEIILNCLLLLSLCLILFLPFAAYFRDRKLYMQTSYYHATKFPYSYVRTNRGAAGEYRAYVSLKSFEANGSKFLFNLYLPRGNSMTTEIDLVLFTYEGIFVIESKNFSGWIFGNCSHLNWTQTLPKYDGTSFKNNFYNPVKQNAAHIRHVRQWLGYDVPIHSIVVFSDDCVLKKITNKNDAVKVINMRDLYSTVRDVCANANCIIGKEDLEKSFDKLSCFSHVNYEIKKNHISTMP